ncbi:MAG: aminotransferase class III-fold pyridoxal phosphate-dependent enzyme [Spirochaetales bacterium]|jgi:acetylornithine/N-succinyldiaminopimelate aminotransferase|nr:aminotransferase class III-fold pyridoxal phosphate-dependent enzyme [Spirochaetales bacterium]
MFEIDKEAMVHACAMPRQYGSDFLVLREGKGVYLYDANGKKYIDFGSGIAVNALGHGRKDLAKIAYTQMRKIVHTSNLYATAPALELAARLAGSGAGLGQGFAAVHFGNSGAEANEAALKYARLYAKRVKGEGNFKLLSFEHAFHGRTMGALSVTPSAAYQEPYAPLLGGIQTSAFNDAEALERTLDRTFAGLIVEVVQGEGGLMAMSAEFAAALNRLCALHDIILIADEVQTGLGRTGTLFASEAAGLKPDVITLAKPLAGGLPLSAALIPEKINAILKTGDHGTTFGGGPVTTAVAGRVWDIVSKPGFLAWVREKGEVLAEELAKIAQTHAAGACRTGEVRGKGLLRGLEIIAPEDKTADVMKTILTRAREKGLLVLRSGKNIVRIAPPLIITSKEIQAGCAILAAAIRESFSAPH